MGRNLVGACGLIVAIGLACQPAHADDRKAGRGVHDEAKEVFVAREVHAVSLRYETPGATTVTSFESRPSTSTDHGSNTGNKRGNAAAPASGHKQLTLFHINSTFGDIAVQTCHGAVNGAQLSLGF